MAFYQGKLYVLDDDENLLVVNIGSDQSTSDPQVSWIGRAIKDTGDRCFKGSSGLYYYVYGDSSKPHTMPLKKLYLVESHGTLLMVRRKVWCWIPTTRPGTRIVAGQNAFEVFKADFEHSRWIKVSTVGFCLVFGCGVTNA